MATCKNCGEELAEDSVFCPNCGERVTPVLKCASCGTELRAGARFCDQCGKRVAESEQKLTDIRSTLTRTVAVAVSTKSARPAPYTDNDYSKYLVMIKDFLSRYLYINSSKVTLDSSFSNLGMDGQAVNELLLFLEKSFGISINKLGTQYNYRTVRDVCKYLQMRGV